MNIFDFELEQAYFFDNHGLHIATSLDMPNSYPDQDGFRMILVNERGQRLL